MTSGRYPQQPRNVSWPTNEWERAAIAGDVDGESLRAVTNELFDSGPYPTNGVSLALLIAHRGRLVVERYGTSPAGPLAPEIPVDRTTPLISWSMAKSITHAVTGMMVADGLMSTEERTGIAQWANDRRAMITVQHLLEMRDGLDFLEDYVDTAGNSQSDVIAMLFGDGATDVATYARARPAVHEAGTWWSYSSGTTNILCSLLGERLGGQTGVDTFMQSRLFSPLSMKSARPTFDAAGTFIGSSFVHATAEDFVRFGYLYLRGGVWEDRVLLAESWIDAARRQHVVDPDSGHGYGAHWWIWNARPGTLAATGYEGQRTIIDFQRDVVIVHLGKWPAETHPRLNAALTRILESFPVTSAGEMLRMGNG